MILLIDNAIPRDDATKLNDLIVDRKIPFFLNEVQTAFYDLEEQNVDSMPYMGHYALYNGEESEFCNILRDLGNHIIDNTDIMITKSFIKLVSQL